jgi:DNA-binding transcriptional LysR family regulator
VSKTTRIPDVFRDLHLLTVIAQARSLTQAANRLGVSKASVSERLAALEKQVGMPLVHRTTRTVALTIQAKQLVDDIRASFDRIEHSYQRISDLAGAPRGLIRVTAPVALGRQCICPSIPEFLRAYPEIRIELDLNDRLVELTQEGFDVAIRHSSSAPSRYRAKLLTESRSMLVASRAYADERGLPEHPEELAHHSCLLYLRDGNAQSWSFQRRAGRRHEEPVAVPVAGRFKANNSEVLREAVQGGLGIGLLPDFSLPRGRGRPELVPVLPDWQPIGFFGDRIYALRTSGLRAPRAVELFIEHVRTALST